MGYWDPEGPSYDGINRWSANDIRSIHLDIPSGEPTSGIPAKIESSGIMPTKTYRVGLHDDGYRAIPVLGLAMSPGPVCWLWLIAALLVVRRRAWAALAVFVPTGVLLLTLLAGPVSGGQRYSLTLFMTLPVAVAAVALAVRLAANGRSQARRSNIQVTRFAASRSHRIGPMTALGRFLATDQTSAPDLTSMLSVRPRGPGAPTRPTVEICPNIGGELTSSQPK